MMRPAAESKCQRHRRGARWLLAALLLCPILAGYSAVSVADDDGGFQRSTLEIRTLQGRHIFQIRIASSSAQQERGLMFETRLPADEGMLFPQSEPRIVSMWMKNTYIPLDMLFIDARGHIACLLANTKPQSLDILSCPKPVLAVLEIGGGEAAERGIHVGDAVSYR